MIYRIIISHNQSQYIHKFKEKSLFVFDAITNNDIYECECYNQFYIKSNQIGNRSINRNTGVRYLLNNFNLLDTDIIEFYDGDRFPIKYNIEKVQELIKNNNLSVVLYICENDSRNELYDNLQNNTLLVDTGILNNPFYSCGFAITVKAIKSIIEINSNMLFNEDFTHWGVEDQYIGLLCHKLGLNVALTSEVILNGKVGGDCNDHDDYIQSLNQYIQKILKNNIELRLKRNNSVIISAVNT